MKLLDVEPYWC